MKRTLALLLLLIVAAIIVMAVVKFDYFKKESNDSAIRVLLPYFGGVEVELRDSILGAYESVLEEEGVPCERISISDLQQNDPVALAKNKPVIIFADGVNQIIPMDVRVWTYDYMGAGGSIAVIYDPGVKGFGIASSEDAVIDETDQERYDDWLIREKDIGAELVKERTWDYEKSGRTEQGRAYLLEAPFARIVGVNYGMHHKYVGGAYTWGYFHVPDDLRRDAMQLPPGKVQPDRQRELVPLNSGSKRPDDRCDQGILPTEEPDEHKFLSGYAFGKLLYPTARVEKLDVVDEEIYAEMIVREQGGLECEDFEKDDRGHDCEDETERVVYPAVILRNFEKGKAMYVNLPLGHLKANSDDLPMRALLRTFLFDEVGFPHVMNTPKGLPGLVFNWHVDDQTEWEAIPKLIKDGVFGKNLEHSFHITAGDYVDHQGDDRGFDACGLLKDSRGPETISLMMEYGEVGSHGGWGHNWFADLVNARLFSCSDLCAQIVRNNACIEKTTGKKVVEYSAPNGAFPQPDNNEILMDLDMVAYYNTADSGSAPNRTFYEGRMITEKIDEDDDGEGQGVTAISFPIMPYNRAASMNEIQNLYPYGAAGLDEWLNGTLDYVLENSTVRLLYSHPYDIVDNLDATSTGIVYSFFERLDQLAGAGKIEVKSMSHFARHLMRLLRTKKEFEWTDSGMKIHLEIPQNQGDSPNPEGLQGVAIAIPAISYLPFLEFEESTDPGAFRKPIRCDAPVGTGISVVTEGRYHRVVIEDKVDEKDLEVRCYR
jgi:hypothetical protein